MTISLCMIVRNEEDNIRRCLDSVKHLVDEMIVVDTGSGDDTVRIAQRYGAKVFFFAWNDSFSDARNHSLKQATGDWILLMDADDEMQPLSRPELMRLIEEAGADAFFFETISYIGEKPGMDVVKSMNPRLLKNRTGYFFSGPIHEQIYCNILKANPGARVVSCEKQVYHYGYLNRNIGEKDKRARNIALLEKELMQCPDDFNRFNLGGEYYAMGDYVKALEYLEQACAHFDPEQGFGPQLLLKTAACHVGLCRFDDAARILDAGLQWYPEFTDLQYMKGTAYGAAGKTGLARKAFEQCLEMGEPPNYLAVIAGAGTYLPLYMLGGIYFDWEDYESAAGCFQRALNLCDGYAEAFSMLVRSWCRCVPEDMRGKIDACLENLAPELTAAAFEALFDEGFFSEAAHYARRHERTCGACPHSQYYKGLCALYRGDFADAAVLLETLAGDARYRERAVGMAALGHMLRGEYGKAGSLLERAAGEKGCAAFRVCVALCEMFQNGACAGLDGAEDDPGSATFILEVLRLLAVTHEAERFGKALGLLERIKDRTVYLRLSKLYYRQKCYALAYGELMRSIKAHECLDREGARMLCALKSMGY